MLDMQAELEAKENANNELEFQVQEQQRGLNQISADLDSTKQLTSVVTEELKK